MTRTRIWRALAAGSLVCGLAACATPPASVPMDEIAPAAWQAPLPHGGQVQDLAQWWSRVQDPLLVSLIESSQRVSASLAQARSRMEQARATQVAAGAALLPAVDAQASGSRGVNVSAPVPTTVAQAGLQASWELDLWGANAASRDAARQRFAGAQALWHEARVSVAADVALQLSSLRTCLQQWQVARDDAQSRAQTLQLVLSSERAGFTAPATAALARASAADATSRMHQQQAQCDVETKALVALTGQPEAALREQLARAPQATLPEGLLQIAALPVQVLSQRPDVYNAEREVVAASAEVGVAQAQRWPRLSLTGSVGTAHVRYGGVSTDLSTWSFGPLALSLPLLDGGRRAAQVDAARARYDEAVAVYQARVRQAVSEVEQALVRLDSTDQRAVSANEAQQGYRASFDAMQARWQGGMASLVELEDARRTWLAAQTALVALQHERYAAWVALYRAAGGGWDGRTDAAPAVASTPPASPRSN